MPQIDQMNQRWSEKLCKPCFLKGVWFGKVIRLPKTMVPRIRKVSAYNTRIQKGGALIEEMRQLVRFWHEGPTEEITEAVIRSNILNKTTRARASDILRRTFIPRFVDGAPRNAWRLIRPLEDQNASHLVSLSRSITG